MEKKSQIYSLYLIEYFVLTISTKQIQLDYYLFNPFGCPDKFMANHRFSGKIILSIKKKFNFWQIQNQMSF